MKTINIFADKPELKYMVFHMFLQKLSSSLTQNSPYELDELVRQELSKDLNDNLALMAYSFNMMNYYHYQYIQSERQIKELKKQLGQC
ncbi:MAG: hypothetical protein IJ563_08060 [Selenomonadaceae bacterium]|nr:hypothetical protein [Selenomonadaceae bacterium]